MRKAEINALGRVFAAEVDGCLPYQSKSKIYNKLHEDGLVQPMERQFPWGPMQVSVRGWQLTHAGRYLYCSQC